MEIERSSIVVVASRLISTGLGFIGTIYYARELGPTVLGSFFLLQSLVGILGVPADLGVQGALEKRISEGEDQNRLYTASLIFIAFSFVSILLLSFLLRGKVNSYLGAPLFWELIALLLVAIFTQLYLSALRGELKIIQSALLKAFGSLGTLTITVGLLIIGFRIYALVYGLLIGRVAVILLSSYIVDLALKRPGKEHFSRIFSFSKYNMVLRTSGLIYSWTDVIIIGWFLTKSAVGVYEIAWRVSIVSILTSDAIANVIFPNFSKLHTEDRVTEIKRIIPKAITYSMVVPIGIFFGALVLSGNLLSIVYGPSFATGSAVLIILLGERIVHSFYKTLYTAMMAFDQPNVAFRISSVSIVINVLLNIVLVPTIGIEGAAAAMLVAYVISAILYYRHVRREIRFILPTGNIMWMVTSGAFMAGLLSILNQYVGGYSIYTLLLTIMAGSFLYLGVVMLKSNISIPNRYQ